MEIAGLGRSTSTDERLEQTYAFQKVSGSIQRVETSPELSESLATTESSLHSQAYLEAAEKV